MAVYCYPWFLHEVGPAEALGKLRECGVDGLQLAMNYHVASYLTPRSPMGRVRSGEQGAHYFSVDESAGLEFPFAVPRSAHVAGKRYLTELIATAGEMGMAVVGWLVYLYSHAVATARPDAAVRNAFGDVHGSQLCPLNPLTRAYVRALSVGALRIEGLKALHVESLSFLPFDYGLMTFKSAVVPSKVLRRLLSLCFCEHCANDARRAGLDVDRLVKGVRFEVDAQLAKLPDGPDIPIPAGSTARPGHGAARIGSKIEDEVSTYLSLKGTRVARLQSEVSEMAERNGVAFGSNLAESDPLDLNATARRETKQLVRELRVRSGPGLESRELSRRAALAVHGARSGVSLYAGYILSEFMNERQLLDAVYGAQDAGIMRHRFYEYSGMTARQLTWLRRAAEIIW